jgi:hypothetical protein
VTQDTRQVFGISPAVTSSLRHYVFLEVVGEIIEGMLVLVRNPKKAFPTEGNVHVEEKFLVPEGVGAVWRVKRTRTPSDSGRHAEYSAVARGQIGPVEIISLEQESRDTIAVYEQLVMGQDIGYVPASSILVKLSDGVVIGPLRCVALDATDRFGFRCPPDSLNEPVGLWEDAQVLKPVSFLDQEGAAREFTTFMSVPQPGDYYDCAPLDHAVRAILKTLRGNENLQHDLTNRTIVSLARDVADLTPAPKTKRRVQRVISALEQHALAQTSLDAFREHIRQDPAINQELTGLRDQVRAETRDQLLREQKALSGSVKDLKAQRDSLTRSLTTLQTQVRSAEADVISTIDRVAEGIRDRLAKLRVDPSSLLAEVAVLRPFLLGSSTHPIPDSGAQPQPKADSDFNPSATSAAVTSLDTQVALLTTLEQNLVAAGLAGGSSKRLGREVLASALAGQLTVFVGSVANELAQAAAAAFSGDSVFVYRVPVGLLDGEHVADRFRRALDASRDRGAPVTLILEGMNRSAFEAYGESIQSHVVAHQLRPGVNANGVIIFGTAYRGPSALPIAASLCELGPTLDTDCLNLGNGTPQAFVLGRVSANLWEDWSKGDAQRQRSQLDDSLLESMEGEASILWRRTIRNAAAQLASLEQRSSSTVVQSMAFGWLLPRAHAGLVPGERFLSALRGQAGTGETADPRLNRLLARLFPPNGSDDQGR